MQGKQQQIVAHSMNGMAYPMQLKVRNTMHNLYGTKKQLGHSNTVKTIMIHATNRYLYNLGASEGEE